MLLGLLSAISVRDNEVWRRAGGVAGTHLCAKQLAVRPTRPLLNKRLTFKAR